MSRVKLIVEMHLNRYILKSIDRVDLICTVIYSTVIFKVKGQGQVHISPEILIIGCLISHAPNKISAE